MALHNFSNNNYISVLEKQEKVANPYTNIILRHTSLRLLNSITTRNEVIHYKKKRTAPL